MFSAVKDAVNVLFVFTCSCRKRRYSLLQSCKESPYLRFKKVLIDYCMAQRPLIVLHRMISKVFESQPYFIVLPGGSNILPPTTHRKEKSSLT